MKVRCAVIMAGGLGERFWPITHEENPKYALKYDGKTSMLEATYNRLKKVYKKDMIYIVTAATHKKLIKKLLPGLSDKQIFEEPFRRNTANAVLLATALLKRSHGKNLTVGFYPADAIIQKSALFARSIQNGHRVAEGDNRLVVFGVKPTRPATGYGYVEAGKLISAKEGAYDVKTFKEKPSLKLAQSYIKKKTFSWNAGIFIWTISSFEKELDRAHPNAWLAFQNAVDNRLKKKKAYNLFFKKLPNVPIDKYLIEKAKKIAVLQLQSDWDDCGSWEALRRILSDRKGNYFIKQPLMVEKSTRILASVSNKTDLVVWGLDNISIVQEGGKLLIMNNDLAEEVKEIRSRSISTKRGSSG